MSTCSKRKTRTVFQGVVGAVASLLTVPLHAQVVLESYTDPVIDLVTAVAFLEDDLDGDGRGEILVGARGFNDFNGEVRVLSSLTGNHLRTFPGPPGSRLGNDVTFLGDVNGDGIGDYGAVGNGGFSSKTAIWGGADRAVLFETSGIPRVAIARLGDLNGDGLEDFAMDRGSGVDVHLGGTFAIFYTVQPPLSLHPFAICGFGYAIEALGDVDGDGVPDFAVSMYCDPSGSNFHERHVFVYSGVDGGLLYGIYGGIDQEFGSSLAAPGDINGDGVGDLAVGGTTREFENCASVPFQGVEVLLFDGRNGSRIGTLCFEAPLLTLGLGGQRIQAVGDADGDGIGDLLVYLRNIDLPPPGDTFGRGEAWLMSVGTGELIYKATNNPALPHNDVGFANALSSAEDWNDDDFPDFLIGSFKSQSVGRVDVYSGSPLGVVTFGTACPTSAGVLPRIGVTGSPRIGTRYPVHLSRVDPGRDAFLAIGFSNVAWLGAPLPIDLGFLGMSGCELSVSLNSVLSATTTTVRPGQGAATITVDIPRDSSLIGFGSAVFAQWLVLNPPGSPTPAATTRGLRLTFL